MKYVSLTYVSVSNFLVGQVFKKIQLLHQVSLEEKYVYLMLYQMKIPLPPSY